jgi:putative ATPase
MSKSSQFMPLAASMRPRALEEFVGQMHLLGHDKPLRRAIEQGIIHSMIFWGPPGSGKTTLAQLLAVKTQAYFERLSAISTGVKDIRQVVDEALQRQKEGQKTILFLDEIHRFNKAQQDVLLPYVENGVFTLIGATTENPSFALNNALLSRVKVYVLNTLTEEEMLSILKTVLHDKKRGLGHLTIEGPENLQLTLVQACDGDARQLLNFLEILSGFADAKNKLVITVSLLADVIQHKFRQFDQQGEAFYNQISALHKAVRGSSPDAALYWLGRLLDAGCHPTYIARRIVRIANEDIGNADPQALTLALNAYETYERLGSPEGELALAQAVIYLSCAAKSNAVYVAFQAVMKDIRLQSSLEVPLHLRNAPTGLMKQLGYGKEYRYAHDEPEAYAAGENYFPEGMKPKTYYKPTSRGLEIKIAEKLARLRELDKAAKK